MNAPQCPHCHVVMDVGFVPDLGHHSWPNEPKWTAGEPERSFWRGIKLKGKARVPISTYRCPRCGLLQSYARAP